MIPAFPLITNAVLVQRGYDYESVSSMQEARTEATGGAVARVTNVVAGFVGPIPNFVADDYFKRTYITRYSFTPFFKMIISFFFLYGFIALVKKKRTVLFPFYVFILLNIIMMIFTFYTLHDRYHWPAIPLFFIVSAWGYQEYIGLHRSKFYTCYSLGVILLILLFNLR